jgi:hypothetical protein
MNDVILHAFDWRYADIIRNAEKIAGLGYVGYCGAWFNFWYTVKCLSGTYKMPLCQDKKTT